MEYFYAQLFATSPEARALFPLSMRQQRERFFGALYRLVSSLDRPEASRTYLAELGRDHRKFSVKDKHYQAFSDALLGTVQHCAGRAWTPEAAKAWRALLGYISAAMRAAAAADAASTPAWWVGEIVTHEVRAPGVAVLTIRPDRPLAYAAGQHLAVQVTRWPRVWRSFSIARAPRPSGLIDLHVRAIPGGLVSNALVHHVGTGDNVLLGPAKGAMAAVAGDRDMLCVAGGTGLAPIKAIIESAVTAPPAARPRKITLFVGARREDDLYDLAALLALESAHPCLHVIPVLSEQPRFSGLTGMLPDVVRGHGLFDNAEVYICGPDAMVRQTALLLSADVPAGHIHHDPLPDEPRLRAAARLPGTTQPAAAPECG